MLRGIETILMEGRTPFMLDSFESEYDDQQRSNNRHALELDQLRNANRNLSSQL